MKVLDLFSGIGGFSLGLERGGMETIAFCEIEDYPRKVLKKHWPEVEIYEDIRNLDGSIFRGRAQVCAGGFPCTQTSIAAAIHGKRTGLEGEDSGLWYEYLRIVREVRPIWVIVENPAGVEKWESEITDGLEGLGFRVSKLEIKASDCGLPHLRKRCFYVANRDGKRLEVARCEGSPQVDWCQRLTTHRGSWLTGSPRIIGGFNGLPDRVDRVKALGNAVVPEKLEIIGRAILEHHH